MSALSSISLFYGGLAILLFVLELLYFKVAERYAIIDKPNNRSSHITPTIRGGGVVFVLALIFWFIKDPSQPWFLAGALVIALISFIDDVKEASTTVRFLCHFIAFACMGLQIGMTEYAWWIVVPTAVVAIGTINAFNFMDGINGITGLYALVNLFSFYLINNRVVTFGDEPLMIIMIIAVVVFLFFNFRKKARCFAGDVGSVTLAFVQLFFVLQLIKSTGNYGWVLLFLVYGIDSVVTIVYRLRKRENILKAHRSHLYQYFSNELKIPHLWVSAIYALIQLGINLVLIYNLLVLPWWFPVVLLVTIGILYVIIRERVLRKLGIKGLIG